MIDNGVCRKDTSVLLVKYAQMFTELAGGECLLNGVAVPEVLGVESTGTDRVG